jgi:tRNA (guanosine-2'-O-)-methyltransferase
VFRLKNPIEISKGIKVPAETVWAEAQKMLSPRRLGRIEQVVGRRIFSISVVLENLYDRGNISAVIRTCEGLGFVDLHVIELQEKFKESQRTTKGSEKWVELSRWKSTRACLEKLKSEGKKILATSLSDQSRDLREEDFLSPAALIFGNEKMGVSPDVLGLAHAHVKMPLYGFIESYNISVAVSLAMGFAREAYRHQGIQCDLTPEQALTLKAHYGLRTQDSLAQVLALSLRLS